MESEQSVSLRKHLSDATAGTLCWVEKLRQQQPELIEELEELLADESITGSSISRAVSATGFKVGPNQVTRHRRGDCRCGAS